MKLRAHLLPLPVSSLSLRERAGERDINKVRGYKCTFLNSGLIE
jgi:hypothetical protein